jgi:TRAP-type C4-dicarboxylate transport system permease small subunit
LLVTHLKGARRHALELWALGAATALAALAAFYSARLAWQSYSFHDVSTSSDATPLWIPQLAMAAGTLVLLIAFVDELALEWRGERVQASSDEMLHNE